MKTIKTQNKELIVVEVPEDAYDFILQNRLVTCILYTDNEKSDNIIRFDEILNCEILGKLSELPEEECSRFVEKIEKPAQYRSEFPNGKIPYYKSYTDGYYYSKAKESLISLLQANGVDTSNQNTILLIEKI